MVIILIAAISGIIFSIIFNLIKDHRFNNYLKKYDATQKYLDKLAKVDWSKIDIDLSIQDKPVKSAMKSIVFDKFFNSYVKFSSNNLIFKKEYMDIKKSYRKTSPIPSYIEEQPSVRKVDKTEMALSF